MDNTEITEAFKVYLIKVLKDFVVFCKENSLQYYMAYGTLLGAARHQGFIPWDDDIDVFMPREDYKRFLGMKQTVLEKGYEIKSVGDDGYYLPFAKFIDTESTIWQEKKYRSIIGVYIDVFPLDRGPEDVAEVRKIWRPYKKAVLNYIRGVERNSLSDYINTFRTRGITEALKDVSKLVFRPYRKCSLMRVLSIENTFNNESGDALICYTSAQYPEVYKREWFSSSVNLDFEGLEVKCPVGYETILETKYGDWHQLPPVEKRVSTHGQYYVNLRERLTEEEVEERIGKGESIVI